MTHRFKTIAFDADDTLWLNEPFYRQAEEAFCSLFEDVKSKSDIAKDLHEVQMKNLPLYGYGAKAYMLSMLETVSILRNQKASNSEISKVIEIGQLLIQQPIELLPGVLETLNDLKGNFQLIVATKGDLLDQERKFKKSGLEDFFERIEIMIHKNPDEYKKLLSNLQCQTEHFLMIGNSVKSDINPVIQIGASAAYIPYELTWQHEIEEPNRKNGHFIELKSIREIVDIVK